MAKKQDEVAKRTAAARAAIRREFDKCDKDMSVGLYVSHHLSELKAAYWKKHTGAAKPKPEQVLELLELRSHWGKGGKDGIDTFDFTLPGGVTHYVVAVQFDKKGKVKSVSMES